MQQGLQKMTSGVMRTELSSPQVRDEARIKEAVVRSQEVMGSQERDKFRGYVRVGLEVLRDTSGSWRQGPGPRSGLRIM